MAAGRGEGGARSYSNTIVKRTLLVADLHVLEHMSFMRLAVVEEKIDHIILDPFCEEITDSEQIEILALLTSFVSKQEREGRVCMSVYESNREGLLVSNLNGPFLCRFAHLQQTHRKIRITSCTLFTLATVQAIL